MKYSVLFWLLLIITAVILCRYLIFRRIPNTYRYKAEEGQTAIVTGSSSGIGCQIAQQLCSRGMKVVWAARDTRKAQNTLNDLVWTPEFGPRGYVLSIDLASLKSIDHFVQEFEKRENRLNLLILNAAYHGPYRLTTDGFEQTIGVNHLGHMYLCYLLLDLMKRSGSGRIVVVSSDLHNLCRNVPVDDLMLKKEGRYGPWTAYNLSKLLNNLFVQELARRLHGTGIAVHAAHPGTPVLTDLIRDSALSATLINQLLLRPLSFFYCRSVLEAAQTPLFAALAPVCAETSGLYFENCKRAETSHLTSDENLARQVWDKSCQLLKIDKNWT